jgi:ribosomal protein S27E
LIYNFFRRGKKEETKMVETIHKHTADDIGFGRVKCYECESIVHFNEEDVLYHHESPLSIFFGNLPYFHIKCPGCGESLRVECFLSKEARDILYKKFNRKW